MAEWYKEAFDELYLDVYPHRDEQEARTFAAFLGKVIPLRGLRMLDVCCGEGRHVRAFGEVGVICFGLDLSAALLNTLKTRAAGAPSVVARGDMRRLPFKSDSFDVCINMFTSFGYFEDKQEELEVLREVWRVLRPGGLFVLDHVNSNWVRTSFEPHSYKERAGLLIEETRRILSNGRIIEKRTIIRLAKTPSVTVRDYTERVVLFGKVELERMLGMTGYEIAGLHGDYEGAPFDEESSPRLLILSRKR